MAVSPTLARLEESPGLLHQQAEFLDSAPGKLNSVGLGIRTRTLYDYQATQVIVIMLNGETVFCHGNGASSGQLYRAK